MDMRQKLLPIFLKEADINLEMLRQFLQNQELPIHELDDLEAAFRAAHTLKGTSQLVQADSINRISRRLEALLEKHFSAKTSPTRVEFEAMQLAVEWLFQLVVALRDEQPDPESLVSEALQALDLAECFPGATPLVELLDSAAQQRAPLLNDPFAADPDLQLNEDEILRSARDPFAEDPDFGMGLDVHVDVGHPKPADDLSSKVDPFAEDADFDSNHQLLAEEGAETAILTETVPFDPFADDSSFLEVENEFAAAAATEPLDAPSDDFVEQTAPPAADTVVTGEDFFAEDPLVEVDIKDSVVTSFENPQPEMQQIDRAKDVVESLLLPKTEDQPRRDYVCCAFELCGHSYYLPIKYMLEISEQKALLPLPLAPAVVKGLINLRGQVMPVIDLSVLHQKPVDTDQIRRLVVAGYKGEKLAFLAEGIPYLSEVTVGEKIDLPKFMSRHKIRGAEA